MELQGLDKTSALVSFSSCPSFLCPSAELELEKGFLQDKGQKLIRTIHKAGGVLHPIPENLIALSRGKLKHGNNKKITQTTERDNLGIKAEFNLIQALVGPIYFMQDNGIVVHLTALEVPNKLTSEN